MFIRLTVLFVIVSNCSMAQTEGLRSPTQFDKFINLQKVQWAAYTHNAISFENYNVSDELYKRFQKNEIKISLPVNRDSLMAGNKIIYLNKNELEERSFAPGNYDNSKKPTNRMDSNSAVINVEEILYVANGRLHSYIPWVSPRISVYTSWDKYLGTSEYFSSCINSKYNFKSSKRDALIFIKTTKRKILIDSFPRAEMLKQLYGLSLLEAIWKDVINDKNEIIDLRSGQKIATQNLKEYAFIINSIPVPVYDSLGNITGAKNYTEPMSSSLFKQIEITQDWYYNYTKNVVVNSIPDITLFAGNIYKELHPFIKIVFK